MATRSKGSSRKRAHETDSECETEKSLKTVQKKKYSQKFKSSYTKDFPCIISSFSRGEDTAFCTTCNLHFKVGHGGQNDIKRHVLSEEHKDNASSGDSKRITVFFKAVAPAETGKKDRLELDISRAEATLCRVIVESNLPLATADKLTRAVQFMCPDSKIASGMKCGRNKATAVVRAMAEETKGSLRSRMKRFPFTISTDGSNDAGCKQYPLVIRCVNEVTGLVSSELLSIPLCDGPATGENIYGLIEKELTVLFHGPTV